MMQVQQQQQQTFPAPIMQQQASYHSPANTCVRPERIQHQVVNPVQVQVPMAGPVPPGQMQMQSPSYTPSPPYAHSQAYTPSPPITVPRVPSYAPQPRLPMVQPTGQRPQFAPHLATIPNSPPVCKLRGSSPPLVLSPEQPRTPSPVLKPQTPTPLSQPKVAIQAMVESAMDQKKAHESGIMPVSVH